MTNTSSGNNEGSSSDPTRQSPQNSPPRSPQATETHHSPIARSPPPRASPPPPAAATRPTQPPPPPISVAVATALRALMNLTPAPGGSSQPTTGDGALYRPVARFVVLPTVPPRATASPPPQSSIGVAGTTAFRPFTNSPPETGAPGGSSQSTTHTLPPPPPPAYPPPPPPMGVPDATAIPVGEGGSVDGGLTIQAAGSSQIANGVHHHRQPPPPTVVAGLGVGADVAEENGHGGGEEEQAENFVVPDLNLSPEPEDD